MKTKSWILASVIALSTVCSLATGAEVAQVRALENRILKSARSFQGQGDPDRKIQRHLEALVSKLLAAAPQVPVTKRLDVIKGPWKQIWGPYDYRDDKRGVDPKLDVRNIFQVVFDGYYYNVNPSLKNGKVTKTVLLRGEFQSSPNDENALQARFTNLRKIRGLPTDGLRLIDLPELSEARSLPGESTALPSFFVKAFFGGGTLKEVYTSDRLRLIFGSGKSGGPNNYLYVMERVIQ